MGSFYDDINLQMIKIKPIQNMAFDNQLHTNIRHVPSSIGNEKKLMPCLTLIVLEIELYLNQNK